MNKFFIRQVFKNICSRLDQALYHFYTLMTPLTKVIISISVLAGYTIIFFLTGTTLGVSANYFILIPLFAIASLYGQIGGFIVGIFALPMNLFLYKLMGHPEFAPENLLIAWISGALTGITFGYFSAAFRKLNLEIQSHKKTVAELNSTIHDKEVLLREVHHRVKNNLAVISSLINLQIASSQDISNIQNLKETKRRVHTIYLVHEKLYASPRISSIELTAYMADLLRNIKSSLDLPPGSLQLIFHMDGVFCEIDILIPLGLIMNELFTFLHQQGDWKDMTLRLDVENSNLKICLKGAGQDLKAAIANTDSSSLSLRLIRTLLKQIHTEVMDGKRNNADCIISIPISADD
jgi:two-component sensor histidine kinase